MRTADGDELVWKIGSVQNVMVGETSLFTGTVKQHSQHKGVDQTEMSRGRFTPED